ARRWLANPRPSMDPERFVFAEAVDSLWREWQTDGDQSRNSRVRRTLKIGDTPILLLTRSTPEWRTALLMSPRFLESAWFGALGSASHFQNIEFALTDADGSAFLGHSDAPSSMQSVRAASTTQLPWTMHVISNSDGRSQGFSV